MRVSIEGFNALDYALRLGRAPIIDVLKRAGAKPIAQEHRGNSTT